MGGGGHESAESSLGSCSEQFLQENLTHSNGLSKYRRKGTIVNLSIARARKRCHFAIKDVRQLCFPKDIQYIGSFM